MNRIIVGAISLAGVFWLNGAQASSAWWMMCDSCSEDATFEYQALSAPGTHSIIYVTNRETKESRKYQRWSSLEDFDGGVTRMTQVSEQTLSASENSALQDIVEGVETTFIGIGRDDLDFWSTHDSRESVVQEISLGYVSNDFLTALRLRMVDQGLFPAESDLEARIGGDVFGISGSIGGSIAGVRRLPVTARVHYEDGSLIQITLSADGETWSQITVNDADGNEISIKNDDGGFYYDISGNTGREYHFRGTSMVRDAIIQLRDWMSNNGGGGGGGCFTFTGDAGNYSTCRQK